MSSDPTAPPVRRVIARHPKARFEYHVLETVEAGIVLTGAEVKSIRAGHVALVDGYGSVRGAEVWLTGCHIAPSANAASAGGAPSSSVDPARPRKLLLHRHEIRRLIGRVERKGCTLVPLELLFVGGRVKVMLALAVGKAKYDKRAMIADRDAERGARRALAALRPR